MRHLFKSHLDIATIDAVATVVILQENEEIPSSFSPAYQNVWQQDQKRYGKLTGLRSYDLVTDHTLKQVFFCILEKEANLRIRQKNLRTIGKALQKANVSDVNLVLTGSWEHADLIQMLKALELSTYEFSRYQTSGYKPIDPNDSTAGRDKAPNTSLKEATWFVEEVPSQAESLIREARVLAETTVLTRDLVNEPANAMTPRVLADKAREQGQKHGFEVEVKGAAAIRELGMDAFWSVAKGSDEEPQLIIMRYRNNPQSDELIALVGKGLTYDSGGYAIKSMPGMMTMFCDMAGSAAVIGTISALAEMKAEVNVVAIVAACENLISGHAFRNGDIISSLAGKQIEIVNTDAEGRLTLADAVCYADRYEGATRIIDIATLTGAAIIALGNQITGVIADDDTLYRALEHASQRCGDKIWRLPCDPELAEQNKSDRADLKNSGGRPAGTTTAGLFIRSFAGLKPWMHLDIAGTAYNEKDDGRQPAGGTGCGAELLYHAVNNLFG